MATTGLFLMLLQVSDLAVTILTFDIWELHQTHLDLADGAFIFLAVGMEATE
jgi:hypothetical protein